jgi:hypothetical protein
MDAGTGNSSGKDRWREVTLAAPMRRDAKWRCARGAMS